MESSIIWLSNKFKFVKLVSFSKGEISKSGTAVLPSKRIRRVVDKTPQQLESVVDDDQVSVSPKVDKEFLVEDAKPEDAKPENVKPEDVKPKDDKPEDSNS